MNASLHTEGDLGDFIVAQLCEWGVVVPLPPLTPALPSVWRQFTPELPNGSHGLALEVTGTSMREIERFCVFLLSPLRTKLSPPAANPDERFRFSIDGKVGGFATTDTGIVVSFLDWGVALSIAEPEEKLILIGITKHPPDTAGA